MYYKQCLQDLLFIKFKVMFSQCSPLHLIHHTQVLEQIITTLVCNRIVTTTLNAHLVMYTYYL